MRHYGYYEQHAMAGRHSDLRLRTGYAPLTWADYTAAMDSNTTVLHGALLLEKCARIPTCSVGLERRGT